MRKALLVLIPALLVGVAFPELPGQSQSFAQGSLGFQPVCFQVTVGHGHHRHLITTCRIERKGLPG